MTLETTAQLHVLCVDVAANAWPVCQYLAYTLPFMLAIEIQTEKMSEGERERERRESENKEKKREQRERENERERVRDRVSEREIERERFYLVVIRPGQSLPGGSTM